MHQTANCSSNSNAFTKSNDCSYINGRNVRYTLTVLHIIFFVGFTVLVIMS